MANYGYFIDLHERGSFIADVRDAQGKTIYEVRAGNELGEDEASPVDDGFMKHVEDIDGLQSYLLDLKLLQPGDRILTMRDFERDLEETEDADEQAEAPRP
ncbi:hypothetical protein [Pseudoxanthomonas kaohsiungensis]|uniref:Uncharacterized protein n=1 Tax=Pseudoxanthomonas kaohsiungensis TaxID=283923 RepID=A0ABW3LZ61_9GAMM|nr:hypothetical protein [Pseudoxanthomonas kaohsiungensis]KAF1702915.1 hypothetical protein CSC66_09070 [Pseudoxanthomonas kaohsiungensis]